MFSIPVGATKEQLGNLPSLPDETVWGFALAVGVKEDFEALIRMRQGGWYFYPWNAAEPDRLARVAVDRCGLFGVLSGRVLITTRPGIDTTQLPLEEARSVRRAFGRPDCLIIELRPGRSPVDFLQQSNVSDRIEHSEIEIVRSPVDLERPTVSPGAKDQPSWWSPQALWRSLIIKLTGVQPHWKRIGVDGTLTGSGQMVGLIDSSFNDKHPSIVHAFDASRSLRITVSGSCKITKKVGAFPTPSSSHGTQCASLIVARPFKSGTPTGIASDALLAAVWVASDRSELALAEAIEWTVDQGADVISGTVMLNSVPGCSTPSTSLKLAVEYAAKNGRDNNGAPVVWAVSSTPGTLGSHPILGVPGIWPIAAIDDSDIRQEGLSGATMFAIAPGFKLETALGSGQYGPNGSGGHSLATAVVAGVLTSAVGAASKAPTLADLNAAARAGCCQIGTSPDDWWGNGVINLTRAVESLNGKKLSVCP